MPPTHRWSLPALAALAGSSLLPFGCAPLDPAHEDLDGLFHYLWDHHAEGVDEELSEAGEV